MTYSNGLLPEKYLYHESFGKGEKGDLKLTGDGDYDIQNKKLVNVKQGTGLNDIVANRQIQLLDGARAGYVVKNIAAIYLSTSALHTRSLYLKDNADDAGNSDEIRIMTEHQSYNNVHLYIPDIKNYDGYGGRRRSEIMVSSVDQTITSKKVFRDKWQILCIIMML